MPPLTVIHDFDVLRDPYALIPLAACRNSRSPYNSNVAYPPIIGYSNLREHPPRQG